MALPRKLIDKLLELPDDARAELAEVLLGSLEHEGDALSPAQQVELDASRAEADRGELIPAEDVLRELGQLAATRAI